MRAPSVTSERFPSKVGAVFESPDEARNAARAVPDEADVPADQVELIAPGEAWQSRKLEPESNAIGRTLVRAHLVMGALGAVVGLLLAGALLLTDARLFTDSPWWTVGWLTAFGLVGGLLLGGFVSLRPDHDPLTMQVEEALRDGRHWAVVVHARDHAQEQRAQSVLERASGRVLATL